MGGDGHGHDRHCWQPVVGETGQRCQIFSIYSEDHVHIHSWALGWAASQTVTFTKRVLGPGSSQGRLQVVLVGPSVTCPLFGLCLQIILPHDIVPPHSNWGFIILERLLNKYLVKMFFLAHQ